MKADRKAYQGGASASWSCYGFIFPSFCPSRFRHVKINRTPVALKLPECTKSLNNHPMASSHRLDERFFADGGNRMETQGNALLIKAADASLATRFN